MPTRRTSPRRSATRPSIAAARDPGPLDDDDDDEPQGMLPTAAPWLALLAFVLAAATLGYVLFLHPTSSDGLAACRTAAWTAIPDAAKLPDTWQLGSTDLNANGMTIS